ncbi:MAG TPA: hypothetical protein ENI23_12375 [bacterium]|nr:hypothetical protein [bacterium]
MNIKKPQLLAALLIGFLIFFLPIVLFAWFYTFPFITNADTVLYKDNNICGEIIPNQGSGDFYFYGTKKCGDKEFINIIDVGFDGDCIKLKIKNDQNGGKRLLAIANPICPSDKKSDVGEYKIDINGNISKD